MFASYMINGWIMATIIAVLAGAVGLFVVLRGMSFAAHALPLGAFPGAAAANLLGINELWGLIGFSGLGVIGITQLAQRQRRDVATALVLMALLGLGTLFLSLSGHYAQGVYALLFGQLVSVSRAQIWPVLALGLVILVAIGICFRPLLLSTLSPDLAATHGVSPKRTDFGFLLLVGAATAMALPVVGALLVFSLMVGPAAAARSLTDRPATALLLSVGLALLTVWASIAAAYVSDWPIGFFVGALAAAFFAVAQLSRRFRRAA
ncbi:metal ABC transporter permease [Acidisoma cellulosilytica]|uniref:Metal ABC transporter permease n=1 Tax=Acidisoma cellulosilyticum TaxID=2802395 RepID=A0A963Z104_9PROT|nr:metal ABC transporter permease [Acidisoma cellulosilyticum]MCB8880720.1 metal ABC transporter permease [Acidisoma cellulosilyticum]